MAARAARRPQHFWRDADPADSSTLVAMPYDPEHRDHETHIRSLIRRATINFDAIVAELQTNGFIDDGHAEMSLTRPGFNSFDSDEFNTLFRFFYPDKSNSMRVLAFGAPMKASGAFVWALYDAERISSDELTQRVRAKYPAK
jgi:hypothetical protein